MTSIVLLKTRLFVFAEWRLADEAPVEGVVERRLAWATAKDVGEISEVRTHNAAEKGEGFHTPKIVRGQSHSSGHILEQKREIIFFYTICARRRACDHLQSERQLPCFQGTFAWMCWSLWGRWMPARWLLCSRLLLR